MATAKSEYGTDQVGSEALLPLTAAVAPGIYYVLLQGSYDTVSIARDSYDEHVRDGDALYLAPQEGLVLVLRDGEVVARITTA